MVIGLLLILVIFCLLIARDAADMTGRLIASGYAAMISFQAFVNIGVATAILPNTGLPAALCQLRTQLFAGKFYRYWFSFKCGITKKQEVDIL